MTREPDPQRLLAAHELATEFYRSHLPGSVRALRYLHSRGIVAATAHAAPWTVGYAQPGWTNLRNQLRAAEFTDEELLAAGLVTQASNGHIIDVFRDRVVFPIRDPAGQVVAFTGRDVSGREGTPKYRNTATTAIYSKKHLLYGMAEQLGGDIQPAAVMLVEGPADVLAIARLCQVLPAEVYPEPYIAVAPCGTALTAEQVTLLASMVPPGTPVVVAFDPDSAGAGAADKAHELLREWPGPVDAIALNASTDPASLVANSGPAAAAQTLHDARTSLVELVIDHRLARFHLDEIEGRLGALRAAAPLIAEVATHDTTQSSRLAQQLTVRLDLDPLTVFEAIYPPDDAAQPAAQSDQVGRAEQLTIQPDQPTAPSPGPATATSAANDSANAVDPIPSGAAGFPNSDVVGHDYAQTCPANGAAATWVQHDPATGHSAWVIAEGIGDSPADRVAARLAAEVAGRAAVIVGARRAVDIARTAVRAHFAERTTGPQGDATITVLTSFDGEQPALGRGRFTVAWAGDTRAYAAAPQRWWAPLTIDHTVAAQAARTDPDRRPRLGEGALTASVRGGPIEVNRIDLPVTHILLASRALNTINPDRLRTAVEGRPARIATERVARLVGGAAAALVVRPGASHGQPVTAARLARQDQAELSKAGTPTPLSRREAAQLIPGLSASTRTR